MNTESTNTNSTVNKSELFGRVKWFNHRLGYGFIATIFPENQPETTSQDVFVHHNAIKSEEDSYKYLVQGEYIQFNLVETTNSPYQFQADEVRGIYNGKLLCDVHNEQKKHTSPVNTDNRSYTNSERPPYNGGRQPYKRDPYESRDRDQSQSYDRNRERETDNTYNSNTSNASLPKFTDKRVVYTENQYNDYKTPRSVRR